jgi:hypothetical protein
MEKDSKQIFNELKENIIKYIEIRFEILKLSTYEGAGKVVGVLSYVFILVLLAFFTLLFLFLSAGFFLSSLFHSQGLGFGCIALLYAALTGVAFIYKKEIGLKVTNEVIAALTANEEKNDVKHEETNPSGKAGSQPETP